MKLLPKILIVLAFLLRLVYVLNVKPLQNEVWSDMAGYVNIANNILAGRWEPFSFFQSIGYPMLIAGLKSVMNNWGLTLSLLQALFSTFSVWIMYRLATWSFGEKIGLWALAIGALHFPWIGFTGYAMPELSFAFFIMLTSFFSYKIVTSDEKAPWFAIGWGLSFTIALWLKGTHVFWGPIFLLGLLFYKKKKAILPAIIISCIVGSGILLHGVLTYKTIGKFQLSASAGGLNFVEGKCPTKDNKDSVGYSWQSPLYYQLRMDNSKKWDRPFTDSSYYMEEGLKCIVNDPFTLIQSLESIPLLFYGNTVWPFNQKPQFEKIRLLELLYVIFFVVGIAMYIRHLILDGVTMVEVMVWILPVLSLFLCVYIFKSEVRFRIPFDGLIIPLALRGWAEMRRSAPQTVLDS